MSDRVIIIAEAGVNHNGDMAIAKQLIDIASQCGADYVKFQTFRADRLVTKDAEKAVYQKENLQDGDETQFNMLKKLELSFPDHFVLKKYCEEKKIKFLSTGFDEESVLFLNELGVEFFKIPSGEITNLPFLRKIASLGKKVVLSTGMAEMEEVRDCISVLKHNGIPEDRITVLHCTTQYPAPFSELNLKAIQTMAKELGVQTGYSDHSPGIEASIAAVALGATIIEKHFTLDKSLPGPDHKASLEPSELKELISSIRNVELALGDGKKSAGLSESNNIYIVRKSIHLSKNLSKDHIIQESDLSMKRPGDGISPMKMDQLIGKKLKGDRKRDHKLIWEDLV